MNVGTIWRLSRPFTLLAPATGALAAALAALGYTGGSLRDPGVLLALVLAPVAAAILNVASNAVNQIYDLKVDRINKPDRPLPSGEMSVGAACVVMVVAYVLAAAAAYAINLLLVLIVLFTAFVTYAYSAPPFRTKRHWLLANLTIAIPRGFLLPVAGWAAISGSADPLVLGDALPSELLTFAAAAGLFVLGAASTKDFADLAGDEAGGCITLPLRFGVPTAARVIAPFLVVPWLLLPVGVQLGWMTGRPLVLSVGGAGLALIGARAAWLLVRDPDALTKDSTHPAWVLMYLLMIASQLVFAAAYVGLR